MCEIRLASTPEDIEAICALAREIWKAHFTKIIGQDQVDYMLEKFQSPKAVSDQLCQGYTYYLVMGNGQGIGYFATVFHPLNSSLQISKIYLKENQRRKGHGEAIIDFVGKQCREMGLKELWLTVNRNNTGPIAFYKQMGFLISESLVQDIGGGFVMDDFKMVKHVS